jgi:hypothetical protein
MPTQWDAVQLPAWRERHGGYDVVFGDVTDTDCPADLDPLGYVASLLAAHPDVDGVTSSSDYPGATLAALFASRRGLPGVVPEALLRASHKYYARMDQRLAAPEAVPPFALVRPGRELPTPFPLRFPCFVKPVKGSFSRYARRVGDREELERFLASPGVREYAEGYVGIYDRLLSALTSLQEDAGQFVAEGVLHGRQVTVEGFLLGRKATLLGVVDSNFHPGTHSFSRFTYPSDLPDDVLQRLEEVAIRVAEGSGLDRTLFNVELSYELASGRIGVIELNPRMCGQFADLYEKVDGTNGYEVAFDLALGRTPALRRREGAFAAAASVTLRTLRPARLAEVPSAERIADVERRHPGTLVLNELAPGTNLTRFEEEDGASIRYGVVNLGGDSRADAYARSVALVAELGWRLDPLD